MFRKSQKVSGHLEVGMKSLKLFENAVGDLATPLPGQKGLKACFPQYSYKYQPFRIKTH